MKGVKRIAVAACVLSIVFAAMFLAGRHTADSKLEERFFSNEAEFAALLAEVSADENLEMVKAFKARYAGHILSFWDKSNDLARFGFSTEQWTRYRQQMRKLGIAQIGKANGIVEFRVDPGYLWNGDSYKGYEYLTVPPDGHQKTRLDGYHPSEDDKPPFGGYEVYKPVKGNWYLYLFIS